MPSLTLTDSQQAVIGPVTAVDKRGNPTVLAGPLTFTSSDPTILTATPSDDGASATIAAVGPEGTVQVTVTDGAVTGTLDVTIIAGAEASLTIPTTPPTEQA